MSVEDSQSFKNFLRVDQRQFFYLLELTKNDISKTENPMRSTISAEERLAVTLRYLATGESFRSLGYSFRIAHNTLSSIIPDVCTALFNALKHVHLKVPSSEAEWENIAREFMERWNFPNCLGALDGKHVVLQAPFKSGSFYFNYKNTHSVVLMALVNANYKFIYVDVGSNGRVSDGGIFRDCTLRSAMEDNSLNMPGPRPLPGRERDVPYVIVGDEAFPLKEYLMKPYPQRSGLDDKQRVFNYRLSRARRIVENAFGILSNRFRVLRSPILLSPQKVEILVLCCCALHNFLRPDFQVAVTECETPREIGTGMVSLSSQGYPSSQNARDIRDEFKEYFCTNGQVPWQTAT
ncbi:uncharacterized protein LOC134238850 [Saccostrea cucullata]|uniref:uncharacterized protein LOC134238850 n=1 Tax=Saccostrea cuccullata TaxID=36930 RepID=UPI002ED44C9F